MACGVLRPLLQTVPAPSRDVCSEERVRPSLHPHLNKFHMRLVSRASGALVVAMAIVPLTGSAQQSLSVTACGVSFLQSCSQAVIGTTPNAIGGTTVSLLLRDLDDASHPWSALQEVWAEGFDQSLAGATVEYRSSITNLSGTPVEIGPAALGTTPAVTISTLGGATYSTVGGQMATSDPSYDGFSNFIAYRSNRYDQRTQTLLAANLGGDELSQETGIGTDYFMTSYGIGGCTPGSAHVLFGDDTDNYDEQYLQSASTCGEAAGILYTFVTDAPSFPIDALTSIEFHVRRIGERRLRDPGV